jgi:molybdate transport system substrate-binding protein
MKTLPKLLLTAVLALFAGRAGAAELNVAAAASLTDALQEIKTAYERSGGDTIVLNLGASSALARQIEEGAPVDLFLSADEAHMDALEKRGRVLAGTRRSVLSNTLVVVLPADGTLRIVSPADLVNPRLRHLALAEPRSVPAGIYAREYLRGLKLWDQVVDRVVPTENVRGALAAVETGNADAGIVYKTDAGISKQVRIAYEVPLAEGPRISYPFAVIAGARRREAARRFLAYLESPAALAVFAKYGFLIQ